MLTSFGGPTPPWELEEFRGCSRPANRAPAPLTEEAEAEAEALLLLFLWSATKELMNSGLLLKRLSQRPDAVGCFEPLLRGHGFLVAGPRVNTRHSGKTTLKETNRCICGHRLSSRSCHRAEGYTVEASRVWCESGNCAGQGIVLPIREGSQVSGSTQSVTQRRGGCTSSTPRRSGGCSPNNPFLV